MAKISFRAPFGPATSSGIAAVPPRSRSRRSSSRQSKGAKKSRLSIGRGRSGERRRTASPSLHPVVPNVLPVTAKSDCPSPLMPPCAHMPPPRARRKARDLARLVNGNADDKAVIGAAIAPVSAERNEDLALKQRQRAALVLY